MAGNDSSAHICSPRFKWLKKRRSSILLSRRQGAKRTRSHSFTWCLCCPHKPKPTASSRDTLHLAVSRIPPNSFHPAYLLAKRTMLCIWRHGGLWLTLLKDTAREQASHRAGVNAHRCCASHWRPSHKQDRHKLAALAIQFPLNNSVLQEYKAEWKMQVRNAYSGSAPVRAFHLANSFHLSTVFILKWKVMQHIYIFFQVLTVTNIDVMKWNFLLFQPRSLLYHHS